LKIKQKYMPRQFELLWHFFGKKQEADVSHLPLRFIF